MKKLIFWLLVLFMVLAGFFAGSFVGADIVINEIMPHTNNSLNNEWIELYNSDSLARILVNWTFYDALTTPSSSNFSIIIPAGGYGLIVDNTINCSEITLINGNCIELNWLGSKLNDGGDSLLLYNSSILISNFTWTVDIKSSGKSWGLDSSGGWMNCTPTPGAENNCTISTPPATCALNTSYGSWSSCSNGNKTRTWTNTSTNCTNITWTEYLACNSTSSTTSENSSSSGITLDMYWNEEKIINTAEWDIELRAQNLLDKDYDAKLWLETANGTQLKAEIYDDTAIRWKSTTYYYNEFFKGSGNKTGYLSLRLKSGYQDLIGKFYIYFRLRESSSESIEETISKSIIINKESASSQTSNSSNSDNSGEVIVLGKTSPNSTTIKSESIKTQDSEGYMSKSEYIKKYAPYAFSILCIALLALILIETNKKRKIE